jgi:hypothetical protein
MRDELNDFPGSSAAPVSRRDAVKGITSAIAAATLTSSASVAAGSSVLNPDEAQIPSTLESTTPVTQSSQTFSAGQFLVDISQTNIRVRHQASPKHSLWESISTQPVIEAGIGDAVFREHGNPLGTFDVTDTVSSLNSFRSIDSVEVVDASKIVLNGTLAGSQSTVSFRLAFHAVSENQLRFIIDMQGASASQYNRVFLNYASSADEAFFGFGQQLTYFNQKGNVIPILVQEHGIGGGASQSSRSWSTCSTTERVGIPISLKHPLRNTLQASFVRCFSKTRNTRFSICGLQITSESSCFPGPCGDESYLANSHSI